LGAGVFLGKPRALNFNGGVQIVFALMDPGLKSQNPARTFVVLRGWGQSLRVGGLSGTAVESWRGKRLVQSITSSVDLTSKDLNCGACLNSCCKGFLIGLFAFAETFGGSNVRRGGFRRETAWKPRIVERRGTVWKRKIAVKCKITSKGRGTVYTMNVARDRSWRKIAKERKIVLQVNVERSAGPGLQGALIRHSLARSNMGRL
jgi:hypothetical protein